MKRMLLAFSVLALVAGCVPEKAQRRDAHDPTQYWNFTYNGVSGKLVGKKWTWWHANGKKSREIEFVEGDSIVVVKEWYQNGRMSSEKRRGVSGDASLREVSKTWYEDGKLESQSWWVRKDTLEMKTEWYKNGVKKCEGGYRQRYGTMREWEAAHPAFASAANRNAEESSETESGKVLISLRHGHWIGWTDKGKKEYEGKYVNGKRQGRWTEWMPNGARYEGSYELGDRKGSWTSWYPNGRKQEEGGYEGVTRHGRNIAWYSNGQKTHEGGYLNGRQDGKWTMWFERGGKKQEAHYVSGKKNGEWKTWHEKGGVAEQGFYADDERDGEWTEWYKNGRKKEKGRYDKGRREGTWTYWTENGGETRTGQFINGERDGRWVEVKDGTTEEGNYRLGKRIGIWTSRAGPREPVVEIAYAVDDTSGGPEGVYANGQKSYEGGCVNGVRNGPWNEWYENGQTKAKGSYLFGRRTGAWTDWYQNGQKQSEGSYTEGLREGPWTEWYDNGKKRSEGGCTLGQRTGHWIGYYDTGEKEWEGDYSEDGLKVLRFEWTRSGDPTGKGERSHDGARTGQWLEWYPDGSRGEGGYLSDKKQGKWLVYGPAGQLMRTEEWKNGRQTAGSSDTKQKK